MNDPRVEAAAKAFGHYQCEDCWYSCPKSEEGCCNDLMGDECSCGLEERTARALAAVDAVTYPERLCCSRCGNPVVETIDHALGCPPRAEDAVTQYERVGWYAKVGGADWWRGSRFNPTSIEGMEWEPVFRQVPRAETETP